MLLAAGALSAATRVQLSAGIAGRLSRRALGRQRLVPASAAATATRCCVFSACFRFEPTVCVRRTQDSFGRSRGVTLLFAKFVPGLATLAAPVAGQNGMDYWSIPVSSTALDALLWLGTLLATGRFFGDLLRAQPQPARLGRAAFRARCCLRASSASFYGALIRRRIILKKLIAARLEPEELKTQLDAGEQVYIIDLRHPLELLPDPFTLPGALHFSPDALARAAARFPATATSCSSAPAPARPQPPKPP